MNRRTLFKTLSGVCAVAVAPAGPLVVDHKSEMDKCRASFDYWVRTYCIIRSKSGDMIPLVPTPEQIKIMNAVDEERCAGRPAKLLVKQDRQVGVSTIVNAMMVHVSVFGRNKNTYAAFAGNGYLLRNHEIYRQIHAGLPKWMKALRGTENESMYFPEGGNRAYFGVAGVPSGIRSNIVFVDQLGRFKQRNWRIADVNLALVEDHEGIAIITLASEDRTSGKPFQDGKIADGWKWVEIKAALS